MVQIRNILTPFTEGVGNSLGWGGRFSKNKRLQRVEGFVRPKDLKKFMKLNQNFQRGGMGDLRKKIPSVGRVWIFSGTTL